MATQYSPDQKQLALEILRDSGGDINAAHIKTGVNERTLYRWRHELWQSWRRQSESPVLPNSPKPLPQFEDDLGAMAFLRQQIMSELLNLANNFQTDMNFMTPTQRVTLITQLTDRLMKLDEHLKPYKNVEEQGFRIDWQMGLYLRNEEGYRGPFSPQDLPKNWKEKYGPTVRLEIFWDDHTFTPLPTGSDLLNQVLDVQNFYDDPCELVIEDYYEEDYSAYG